MSSSKLLLFALLTKIPKSPTTRICSKIPSPCSINKILIIPHYLHLFQNFFSFLNFLSPLSKILFSHYQRSIYMGIVFLSPSVAALSSQGNCFFLSSLRFAISTSIVPSASVVALSSQKKNFYPQICNFYRYCPLFPLFISISDLPYLIFVQLRGSMILRLETVTLISQPIWQQSISMIYIYILTENFYSIVHFGIIFRSIYINVSDIQQNVICGGDFKQLKF